MNENKTKIRTNNRPHVGGLTLSLVARLCQIKKCACLMHVVNVIDQHFECLLYTNCRFPFVISVFATHKMVKTVNTNGIDFSSA